MINSEVNYLESELVPDLYSTSLFKRHIAKHVIAISKSQGVSGVSALQYLINSKESTPGKLRSTDSKISNDPFSVD